MTRLPQSVRDRLAAQQQPATDHPDADMLTAFMEDALTAGERGTVLEHLARCPTCRDVVAVSASVADATVTPEPVSTARKSRWNWGVLRWAAPAVAVVVIGAAVLLNRDRADVAEAPSYVSIQNEEGRQQVPAAPKQESLRDERRVPESPTTKKSVTASEPTKARVEPQDREYELLGKRKASVSAKNDGRSAVAVDQVSPMGGALASQSSVVFDKDETAAKPMQQLKRQEAPAAAVMERKSEDRRRENAVALQAEGPITEAVPQESVNDDGRRSVTTAAPSTVKPAPKETDSMKVASAAAPSPRRDGTVGAGNAANYSSLEQVVSPPRFVADWRVSRGRLSKTYDRITWEEVQFPGKPEITNFAAVGPHAWAGGKGGVLFHSIDNGENWSRVYLGTPPSKENIRDITFDNINFGRITTSSGTTWVTNDAGQTWTRE